MPHRACADADSFQQAQHPVRRLRALGDPGLGGFAVEHEAGGVVLLLQRVERADLFDETAVARHARIGHDDGIEWALLGAATGESDFQGHLLGFLG